MKPAVPCPTDERLPSRSFRNLRFKPLFPITDLFSCFLRVNPVYTTDTVNRLLPTINKGLLLFDVPFST